jgi:hypothetical protein
VVRPQPVIEHEQAEDNQQRRPIAGEHGDADDVGGIEQQNETDADQQDGADRKTALGRTDIKMLENSSTAMP